MFPVTQLVDFCPRTDLVLRKLMLLLVGWWSDRQNVSGPDRLISFHLERSSSVDGSPFFRHGALEFNVIKNKTRS